MSCTVIPVHLNYQGTGLIIETSFLVKGQKNLIKYLHVNLLIKFSFTQNLANSITNALRLSQSSINYSWQHHKSH